MFQVSASSLPSPSELRTVELNDNLFTTFPADPLFALALNLDTLELDNNPIETLNNVTRSDPVTIKMNNGGVS